MIVDVTHSFVKGQDGASSSSNEEVRVPLCSIIRVEPISANSDSTENSGNGQTAYQKLVRTHSCLRHCDERLLPRLPLRACAVMCVCGGACGDVRVRVVGDQVKKAIPAQLRQKKKYVSSMQSVSHSEQLVDVWCKDLRTIRLGFGCFTDARKLVPTVPPLCGPFTVLECLLTLLLSVR